MAVTIGPEDPTLPEIVDLLEAHLEFTRGASPPDHVHALDLDGLVHESVSFFAGREDGELLGVGALRELGHGRAEIKSMHTTKSARGRGVGRAMLEHLMRTARGRNISWLGLETGSMDEFAPARRLYRSAGFSDCEPFDRYTTNPFSVCMSTELSEPE
ncbi:MAG: GNAT family N-acetyltransferase [Actinomycetota bacterium]